MLLPISLAVLLSMLPAVAKIILLLVGLFVAFCLALLLAT